MMNNSLPYFKYHPNPIEIGNVEQSDEVCICCNRKRGFVYTASIYTWRDLDDSVCPWCIADGSAAEKFEAEFSDAHPLAAAELPEEIIKEVTERTPGYTSWQQGVWLAHCNDACEFHGDALLEEVRNFDENAVGAFQIENQIDMDDAKLIIQNYQVGGDPAIYKFVCRHCGVKRYFFDCS